MGETKDQVIDELEKKLNKKQGMEPLPGTANGTERVMSEVSSYAPGTTEMIVNGIKIIREDK